MKYWVCAAVLLAISAQGELSACMEELIEVVSNFATVVPADKYQSMASYSGKGINDLGDYFSCCNLKGAEYALFSVVMGTSSVYLSLCGPQVCTAEDYYQIIGNLTQFAQTDHPLAQFSRNIDSLAHIAAAHNRPNRLQQVAGMPVNIVFPQSYIHRYFTNLSAGAIVMLVVCILLGLVATAGTIIDILQSQRKQKVSTNGGYKLMEIGDKAVGVAINAPSEQSVDSSQQPTRESLFIGILLCFSLYTNVPKLFASRSAEKVGQAKDTLDILNAVRVMSMGWVILGHTYAYRFLLGAVKNPLQLVDNFKDVKTAIIYAGLFSVDSFFWLSGFLMAFLLLQQLNSPKSLRAFDWVYLYVHRFYRILPAYMFILFFTWAFTKYVGNGPLWYGGNDINGDCRQYWWTNLLFLNNFIPDGNGSGCLGQSWYLANDMQFFIISPPIFFLYHKVHRLLGWLGVSALCLCAVLSGTILANENHYVAVYLSPQNTENNMGFDYYIKPYCRVAPYAVGIACGMVLYSYRFYKKTGQVYDKFALWLGQIIEKRWVRYAEYALGMFLINFFIFIQYNAYKDVDHGWDNWNQAENDLFVGFNRFFWSVGMSLMLMPMLLGYNAVATRFMSLSIWAPLARLTFCTYLIHLHLIFIVYLSQNEAYWFNDLNITITLWFITLISYAAAVPLTLMVESPFMAFEKLMKTRSHDRKALGSKGLI